ncbi:hypothetical protein RUM43_003616 [Polyplax serrata]|uniref:Uncharacterized protein n=1 Tax=Polyplax serrata TaxID=468196 RepID=A0AAN8S9F3_POLSC
MRKEKSAEAPLEKKRVQRHHWKRKEYKECKEHQVCECCMKGNASGNWPEGPSGSATDHTRTCDMQDGRVGSGRSQSVEKVVLEKTVRRHGLWRNSRAREK